MIFLNPAVLFGLIATAIPVLIHLLNLRKLKRIDFSTLAFLKELQKNKIRKVKVKQWLLLALRVLIILFIVAAFARPAIKNLSIGGTTSSAKTTAVFILDNTFSMSVINEKGSSYNRAKQVIKNLMYELQEGDEAAFITTSDLSNEEVQATRNLLDLRKKIEQNDISFSSGTLHNAMVKAAKVLDNSKNFNKEIYVLSDFQKSRFTVKNESFSDLSSVLDERVKIYFFDFSGKDVFNLSISNLELNNQILEKDKTISFTSDVKNYSGQAANNIIASLFINGQRSAQQSISLAPGETKKILFETVLKQSGNINISAELEDDDILQDNKRSLTFKVPEKISAIIFSENDYDAHFIELALSANQNVIEFTKRNFKQVQSVNLNNYGVAILIGYSPGILTERLYSYLDNGGNIFLMPGANTSLNSFREISAALKIPIPEGIAGDVSSGNLITRFDKIDFEHPIFAGLFEKTSKKQVESPDIYHYFKTSTQGKGKSIISLVDNSTFLSEYSVGKGRMLLMNTAPVLDWSNLPLKGIFVPLITKSIFYLTSKDQSIKTFFAGTDVLLTTQNSTLPQIKVVKPDNNVELLNLEGNLNSISFNKTDVTGNYYVYSGENQIDYFSVNPNPQESDLVRLLDNDIDDYLKKLNFQGKTFYISPDENYTTKIQQARFGSELWKYFLMLAFVLAIIEMMLARNTKKELV